MSHNERVALVVGAAGGIGSATCHELLNAGWAVVAADLQPAASRSGDLQAIEIDVTDTRSVEDAVARAVDWRGHIDLLVNAAGIQRHGAVETLAWDDWTSLLDVNLHGVLRCIQAAGRHMLAAGRGAIVNITSITAERGCAGRAPYTVAKAGVVALTRTAAVEWASRGVRVNAVGPGYVDTEMVRSQIAGGRFALDAVIHATPMGRLATEPEIAKAIRFLGSDDASYITGQVLWVDGGFLADYGIPSTAVNGGAS